MPEQDRLYSLISDHFHRYQPSMVEQLRQQNRLDQVLEETAEQFSNFLFEMVSVKKMEYNRAWELAIQAFLLPEESSSTSQKTNPPATSASATLTRSEWAARMKKRKQT